MLVAEDNEINALLTRSLLTKLGHRAAVAESGGYALERWQAARDAGQPFDLILMDMHMPGVDGLEAARRIRAAEAGAVGSHRTPIIALTANAFAEDREACLDAGMDGFLVKPLDRDRLVASAGCRWPASQRWRRNGAAYNFRSATSSTMWLSPFFRIRSARCRVGRMFSCRFTRLILSQIDVAVCAASSSLSLE